MKSLTRVGIQRALIPGFPPLLENESQDFKNEFLGRDFSPENLQIQAKERIQTFTSEQRATLCHSLKVQYQGIEIEEPVAKNLQLLQNETAVTITTGHQLSLMSGPMFFVYKILHVLNLCELLNARQQEIHYVPLFWLASEDHDFDEIKTSNVFQQSFTWDSLGGGAVGRFSTDGLGAVYQAVFDLFRSELQDDLKELFNLSEGDSYGQHVFKWVNRMFGTFGLVVLDADNPILKKEAIPLFEKELTERTLAAKVSETNTRLAAFHKKPQVFVRPINVFHLSLGNRQRVEEVGSQFKLGEESVSEEDLRTKLHEHPGSFSPNALLRPIFQEFVLPNVCYVGGGGELAYWTQLKSSFESFGMAFPILQTRISAFIVKQSWISSGALHEAFAPLEEQVSKVRKSDGAQEELFHSIDQKAISLVEVLTQGVEGMGNDAHKWAGAEVAKLNANLDAYKLKWQRQHKQKFEQEIRRLEKVHQQLYPNGIPQERHQNLLHFCPDGNWRNLLSQLKEGLDPLNEEIQVFIEEGK
jgi:bacillithiol biosynthesis cysteine-adding enzyme BshC